MIIVRVIDHLVYCRVALLFSVEQSCTLPLPNRNRQQVGTRLSANVKTVRRRKHKRPAHKRERGCVAGFHALGLARTSTDCGPRQPPGTVLAMRNGRTIL
jgi:hypothetical protein